MDITQFPRTSYSEEDLINQRGTFSEDIGIRFLNYWILLKKVTTSFNSWWSIWYCFSIILLKLPTVYQYMTKKSILCFIFFCIAFLRSSAVQFTEIFHFLNQLRIRLIIPLLKLYSLLHLFQSLSQHSAKLNGHILHFLFKVCKLLFFLFEFLLIVQFARSQLLFAFFFK